MEKNKSDEIEFAERWKNDPSRHDKPFGSFWGHRSFGKWETVIYALRALGVPEGASVLDSGAGTGWTTAFLAESGFRATGFDIAEANVEVALKRAERTGTTFDFVAADMDTLNLDATFDAILVFDALHHSARQAAVVERLAAHLKVGGWIVFGEPSWMHAISPSARRVNREFGWIERGVTVRALKRDCASAGLGNVRRFYEGTGPTESVRGLAGALLRLVAARFSSAPQMSVWIAAQKLPSHR